MATFHSNNINRRSGARDEPEELRQLRQQHGGSLSTLKELFADWTEEDLLYAIQDAGGDIEAAILRISDGHATQWGEVKGKKKTPKSKSGSEKQEFRTSNSHRGGFAGRGRGESSRGGRGNATRGGPRTLNGGDRNGRTAKLEVAAASENTSNDNTIVSEFTEETAPEQQETTSTSKDSSSTTDAWSNTAPTNAASTDSWTDFPATTTSSSSDSWGAAPSTSTTTASPARKVNTATIPAGSKLTWAKIVKPNPPPQPVVVPAPVPASVSAPVSVPAPVAAPSTLAPTSETAKVDIPEPESAVSLKSEEPTVEKSPESTSASVEEEKTSEEVGQEQEPVVEPVVEEEKEEEKEKEKEEESVATETTFTEPIASTQAIPLSKSAGPPGLKQKATPQPRRLNQDAPVVISGSSSLQSVGLKFGSFSLNDESEAIETEPEVQSIQPTQPAQQTQPEQTQQNVASPAAQQQSQQQQSQQQQQPQQSQQQQPSFGRQPNTPSGASGYQGSPAANGLSPATNAAYLKQDPAASYLGHHHPAMGHDAMGSPYGSFMPNPASQLGSFGMGPMASLPTDYAALYGNDLQRAMHYYDPSNFGQIPVTAANNYQSRDSKFNQDASATTSTSGASNTASTQAQQTLQQQQQQQQPYPGMAGGLPYYHYYYMPNQFPNYQQSGYGQPFVNKNIYPMYQQQHSNKPGANSSPYGSYNPSAQHQYSQGYEDLSGAGIHGMGLNDPYAKYGNPGMQNYLGNQQQPAAPASTNTNAKGNTAPNNYAGSEKSATSGAQASNPPQMTGGASSLQGQQPGNANQGQQGFYQQQQMYSNYQYHQGYHPNQHQGQHQGSGRNQFWGTQN